MSGVYVRDGWNVYPARAAGSRYPNSSNVPYPLPMMSSMYLELGTFDEHPVEFVPGGRACAVGVIHASRNHTQKKAPANTRERQKLDAIECLWSSLGGYTRASRGDFLMRRRFYAYRGLCDYRGKQ